MTTSNTPSVQSLVRGLDVIRSFGPASQRQTLSQVAAATGLARATARRFLHTLIAEGYADTNGQDFWLTPRILELGYSYMSGLGLPAIAQPHLEKLVAEVGESSSLSVLDGTDVVYVSRVPVRRIMTVNITIGTRFPAYATSMGRVLLAGLPADERAEYLKNLEMDKLTPHTVTDPKELAAELDQVASQGYCIVNQELELGLRSLAAPVVNPQGEVVAAVNVSTQTAVHTLEDVRANILPAVRATAEAISHDLAAAQLN